MALIAIGAAQICTDIHAERVVGVMLQSRCQCDRHGDNYHVRPERPLDIVGGRLWRTTYIHSAPVFIFTTVVVV